MRYRVLGPLEVTGLANGSALSEPKERRLLAVLLASRGQVVSMDALIDGIWGERPPRSAVKAVHGYVLKLRRAVAEGSADGPIRTVAPGYVLDVQGEDLDATEYLTLVERGQRALALGDYASAIVLLDEAAGLWRGEPYAEFAGADFADREIARLEQARASAAVARVDAALGVGESSA
ncbi:MAG: winged helix-turn-helix domain-containing protein, partial [Actinomycetota bacterium]|nr:winged helix-turn-helix domain-containing protein [Actinomycetota bacterium]